MKIVVAGTRGIPDIPGGVESHCQQLYPIIAESHEVVLCRRSAYIKDELREWHGVQIIDRFSPRKKSLEAIIHTALAIIAAKRSGADIVHIHAVGPAILVPFARLLGMKVVMTNHGPDYDRQKWGKAAKTALRFGEWVGGKFANEVIVISEVIRRIVSERCGRDSTLIYNGVTLPQLATDTDFLSQLGVSPNNYVLAVARFVPEKGLHDLIEAFGTLDLDCKLVIAGDSDHEDRYSADLKRLAAANPRIVLTGYIVGRALSQIFTHARLFVLPSYHEGLPIALLEALSYGLPALVSDIPANKEVALPPECYFKCGDTLDLAENLAERSAGEFAAEEAERVRAFVERKYDWATIARQTIEVYERALGEKPHATKR